MSSSLILRIIIMPPISPIWCIHHITKKTKVKEMKLLTHFWPRIQNELELFVKARTNVIWHSKRKIKPPFQLQGTNMKRLTDMKIRVSSDMVYLRLVKIRKKEEENCWGILDGFNPRMSKKHTNHRHHSERK